MSFQDDIKNSQWSWTHFTLQHNAYYLIWILVHFTYDYYFKIYNFLYCNLWKHLVLNYFVSFLSYHCCNSRLYIKLCYCFYYYRRRNSQKTVNDEAFCSEHFRTLEHYLEAENILSVIEGVSVLSKTPKHIAFNVLNLENQSSLLNEDNLANYEWDTQKDSKRIDDSQLSSLCRLIYWSWLTEIGIISLYDPNGHLKNVVHRLRSLLKNEIEAAILFLKSQPNDPKLVKLLRRLPKGAPTIRITATGLLDTPEPEDNLEGTPQSVDFSNTIHIFIFSRADGKQAIVQTVNQLTTTTSNQRNAQKHSSLSNAAGSEKDNNVVARLDYRPVSEATVNSVLSHRWYPSLVSINSTSSNNCAIDEPDVLVILGQIKTTMGFLPWNLRLTQIYWVPELLNVYSEDFVYALQNYSKSQQRFGT